MDIKENPMKMDIFTAAGQKVIFKARQITAMCGGKMMEPDHLLAAVLQSDEELLVKVFEKMDIDPANLLSLLMKQFRDTGGDMQSSEVRVFLSRQCELVVKKAVLEADNRGREKVDPIDILLVLTTSVSRPVMDLLRSRGLLYQNIIRVLQIVEAEKVSKVNIQATAGSAKEEEEDPVEAYCSDLVEMARNNKFDPVIGRDEEVRRVIQVLSRRGKNNPVLLGEPGVGKTAISEGLAQRILTGDVPETLKSMRLLALDLSSMVAGAKYRGDFEDRLKKLLEMIQNSPRKIILFIDELHTLVGAGATDGAMDASNMLKPALARGELRCVGATTFAEYKKYIEKDPALARRFQQVIVPEPSEEDCIGILRGLKEKYEVHHGVRIRDSAIVASVKLSKRYIQDRFLPDKAIDLVDEAASKLRIEIDSMPTELDVISRRINSLEVQKAALSNEGDENSLKRIREADNEIGSLRNRYEEFKSRWEEERFAIREIRKIKEEIEDMRNKETEAVRNQDYELASQMRYGAITQLEKKLAELNKRMDSSEKGRILKEEVDEDDIGLILSRWTGIPMDKMMRGEKDKLVMMEKWLTRSIIGQERAVKTVANTIRRARAGIQDPNRPWGSFIFIGPTGVGKTEMVKSLADFLFNDPKSVIRLDMSEFMEKHSVSKLTGSPPGYVGHEEGGFLTEAVRRKPFSVVLFDEVEKAHPEVYNVLLQVLDEGFLTDSKGIQVNFNNTIVVMTTNLGSELIMRGSVNPDNPKEIRNLLYSHFKPEFINRLDETVIFDQLKRDSMMSILELQITKMVKRMAEKKISCDLSKNALIELTERGYDPEFGARPLRRVIQSDLQDPIAMMILDESILPGQKVYVDFVDNKFTFVRK